TIFLFSYYCIYSQTEDLIKINVSSEKISINDNPLIFSMEKIKEILGEPSRIKKTKKERYVTRKNIEGHNIGAGDRIVKVEDTYMIYDQYGLIFCTSNGIYTTNELSRLIVFFPNKREFDNRGICDFEPVNRFKGALIVNGEELSSTEKIIPDNITYKTDTFRLFKRVFGTASFAMEIDMIYTFSASPYMEIYLNNGSAKKISTVVIKKTID
ncbi:MAG: hypothetical protein ABIJ97_11145, partial [Bacteroidota bacterium]